MKKFLLATVSVVAMSCVSRAADLPAAMPTKERMYAPSPVATWDGAYIGVQGGVVRRNATFELFGVIGLPVRQAGDETGGTGGILAGYNWQQGNYVYGLEGDWSWIGAKSSHLTPGIYSSAYDVNWLATIRGRAGYAIDSTLLYFTGGAAFGHVKNDVVVFSGPDVFISTAQSQTKVGWTIGAGVEHQFAPQWAARAEFRYVDLGKTGGPCAPGTGNCTGYRGEFSNTLMMGLVGLNYKFGGGRGSDGSHAQAYMPVSNLAWSGSYLGIQGGIARHDAFFNDTGCFIDCGLSDQKKTGGAVGGLVGYNWQQGSFVYGVEGDWNWIGAKTSGFTFDSNTNRNLSPSYDVNWLATVRGRVGLAFDATLFYVTGGVAVGHVQNTLDLSSAISDRLASFTQNQTKAGWTAGVGAEHMFGQHWSARAEFRYVDLGKTNVACSSATNFDSCMTLGQSGGPYRGEFSNKLMLGLVGLAYKF